MEGDNVITVNLINFITVGLMAVVFAWIFNKLALRFFPVLALTPPAKAA